MTFFWKKETKIENMLMQYFECCDACLRLFDKAMKSYFDAGYGDFFSQDIEHCHKAESAADDIRRDIELTLYGKALLPESRGDLLGLLEAYDMLPNAAQNVVFTMNCQQLEIPGFLRFEINRLIAVNLEAYFALRKTVDALFGNPRVTLHAVKEVDERESDSDRLERSLMMTIFASDMETAYKILLRDLVLKIAEISNQAEKTADRIGIIAIKRQV